MKCIVTFMLIAASAMPATAQTVPSFVTVEPAAVSIGDGAGPYFLNGVADATRRADGTIIVGACGSADLRIYDARGMHLRTVGRQGEGPGEFQYIHRLFPAGADDIAVFDRRFPTSRISIFTEDGSFVRDVTLPFSAEPVGRTSDGQFVLLQPEAYRSPRPALPPGLHRRATVLYKMSDSGTVTDSIIGLPGHDVFVLANGPVQERTPRFPRRAVIAVHPDKIIFGAQDGPSFLEISADFRTRREWPTITQPQPVTAALQSEWEATRSVLAARGGVLPVYADVYSPATPAYRDIIVGTDGRVWIQDPELPGDYPLVWTAYLDGRPAARVELPTRFFPFEFGADWVLGVWYDDAGVERVQIFDLTRGALSGRKLSPREAAPPNVPRCGSWMSR